MALPPTGLTVVPGSEQLRITWTAVTGATSYKVYVDSLPPRTAMVPTEMTDGHPNGQAVTVRVSAVLAAGETTLSGPVTATPTAPEGPAVVASLGPNGTHWPDRTPHITSTPATVIECACTWAAIKAAINGLSAAQVNAGARINVQPGTLPGSGGSAGSPAMMDTVGDPAWRKRVLVTPRDGKDSINFAASIRLSKVYNVCFAGWDLRPQSVTFSGCSYSAMAWSTASAWRVIGIGGSNPATGQPTGVITQGFDMVEVVIPDVQVGELDPAGLASGYAGPAGNGKGNGWTRYCRIIGCYCAPQYLPTRTYDANGNLLTGYGHNDSCQLYGSGVYYAFRFVDTALWGSNNCALQIGGWVSSFDALVGSPISYFLKLEHCMLITASKTRDTRYPQPPGTEPLSTGGAINGGGRANSLSATDTLTIGSLYTTYWDRVERSICTVIPRPALIGAWTRDNTYLEHDNADFDAICPIPTAAYLASIWAGEIISPLRVRTAAGSSTWAAGQLKARTPGGPWKIVDLKVRAAGGNF